MRITSLLTITIWTYCAVVELTGCESLESHGSLRAINHVFGPFTNSISDGNENADVDAEESRRNLRKKSVKPDSKKVGSFQLYHTPVGMKSFLQLNTLFPAEGDPERQDYKNG
jgi:hypothetical protein